MKKEYICPDVEYISLIAEEKITSDIGGEPGLESNDLG